MKRLFWVTGLLLILVCSGQGQKKWTLEDAVFRMDLFLGKRLSGIRYIPGSRHFSTFSSGDHVLRIWDSRSAKVVDSVRIADIRQSLVGVIDTASWKMPLTYEWKSRKLIRFWYGDTLLEVDPVQKTAQVLLIIPGPYERRFVSPDLEKVILIKDSNLYLYRRGGESVRLTEDGSAEVVYGDDVHRREFGIEEGEGVFWSPGSRYAAFYRKDQSMVTDYPYLLYLQRPMGVKYGKYPMAGMNNHLVKVGILDTETGRILYTDTGEDPDVYLTSVTWSSDDRHLFLARVNRDQNRVDVMVFSQETNWKPEILFTITDSIWTEPEKSIIPVPGKPDQFLWYFYAGNYRQLSLYSIKKKKFVLETRGSFDITQVYGFSPDGNRVWYQATGENPLDRHIFVMDLSNGQTTQVTHGNGSFTLYLNPAGDWHLVSSSRIDEPWALYRVEKNQPLKRIYQAKNPMEGYAVPGQKMVTLKSDDGCELHGLLLTPPDLKEGEKYPVLIYVYGGPHSQLVRNQWLGIPSPWLYYMAQQGFVIWVMDNHGTENRGKHFAQANFRRLGSIELSDQLKGVQYLKSLLFVDSSRIGVHGWSYGGFMTLTMMSRAPEHFRVGVAGAPVVDWKYYETIYTERYMDTPERNPEGYEESSILNHIGDMRGRLLVIHGTADETVVWQHTILLLKEAIKKNVQMDYFIFPGHKHGISGKDRFYLYQKMTDYFFHYLEKEEATNSINSKQGGKHGQED